jgi:CheY-like chemotaxis protein
LLIGLLEDDLAIQEMLRLLLQSEGHDVRVYATAAECLADLRVTDPQPGSIVPNLLLVDLHLSKAVSGSTVIEQIRANPRLKTLPIILMTAAMFLEQQELARLQVTLLAKPFDIDDVTRLINELTGQREF